MKRTLLLSAFAFGLLAGSAQAQSTYISGSYGSRNWDVTITRVPLMARGSSVISVPRLSEADQLVADERERLWTARCEPKVVVDNEGIPRYHYKVGVVGCSAGKWQ